MEPQKKEEIIDKATGFLGAVIGDATASADKEQRKTVTAMDVVFALKKNKDAWLNMTNSLNNQASTGNDSSGNVQTLPKNPSE